MPQGILLRLGLWQNARRVTRNASIPTPDHRRVLVFEVEGSPDETGIVERYDLPKRQAFIDFRVENKPYAKVVAQVKRQNIQLRKQMEGGLL
jgi:hypothetical protein